MFITSHAKARMRSRLDAVLTRSIESHLESIMGVPGRYVYIVRYLAVPVTADDGSNGICAANILRSKTSGAQDHDE